MSTLSSIPAPDPGSGVQPELPPSFPMRPSVVPPKQRPDATPPKRRTALWGTLIAFTLLAGGAAYYLNTQSPGKVSGGGPPVVSVSTAVVGMGDLQATVRVNGTVSAQNFASLLAPRIMGSRSGFNRGGNAGAQPVGGGGPGDFTLVLMRLAKAGSHIKTGDVAAEFDPQFQVQRLDDYKDSVVQLENSIKKMVANLAATKEAHDQTVRSAKADWDKAVLDLKTADIRSAIDAEKFKLAVEEADAKYKQLVYESSLVVESQRAAIRSSELNRDQSKIELQRAELNVQKMVIKSPMDGIVVMQSIVRTGGEFGQIREGDQISAGQPFMSIVDPGSMVLNATVNQVDAERLRLGMRATLRLDAYPDIALPGALQGIGAMAKISAFRASWVGEIPIRLKIDKMDSRVIPDLTGSAEIVVNSEKNVPLVSREAVFDEEGGQWMFVQAPDGVWTRKKVETGLLNFTAVAIRSGVREGDVVALQRPM
ncbi:MAG TPA: HlyD family efflux transporter periplasmic adaptor subunit [Candidatus Acidoferrales bacterium]|jgi:HlyD family secretion protein|nr:HlyD family efflux transporter periplasmic adaptor subunit [Candidatus Acidoferrales bacterium]